MIKKLPPLNSIKAFAVAAKHQSFTKAASELNVTQGAISKQIAILEEYLGLDLFERKHQSLILTKAAKNYLESLESALKIIEESSAKIAKKSSKEVLNISVLPSLSNQWLMPKIKEFRRQNLEYKINLFIADSHVDFDENHDIDLAIRIAKKNCWKNFLVRPLFEEKMVCICAPKFLKSTLKNCNELLRYNLLLHNNRSNLWQEFFKYHKVKNPELEFSDGYQHFFMLINAAKNGSGIALVPEFLVKNEIENSQLKLAFDGSFKSGYSYYLIHPKPKAHLQKIEDFKNWIIGETLSKKVMISRNTKD